MHDIVHELEIAAPPDRVYRAVTDPADLLRWWAADVALDVESGDLRITAPDQDEELHFQVDTVAAPEMAHLTCVAGPEEWPSTQLAFRIERTTDQAGSVVRFWHGGWEYEDGVLPRVSFAWAMRLDALRRYLEGPPAA
jgi:uncharacterized protein YndB with AHSA1/START domain